MKIRQLKISALSLILLFPLLVLLTLIACSSPNFIARSETSEYCKSCHVMEAEYEAWMHSGAHRRKMCVDCHLPNENRGEKKLKFNKTMEIKDPFGVQDWF